MNNILIVLLVLIGLALLGVVAGIILMIKWIRDYKRAKIEERITDHLEEREE